MLWTVMPPEVIWGTEEAAERRLVRHRGRLVVARVEGATGVVETLLSTDPMDFLSADWQPGVRFPLPAVDDGVR
jgi:hypothetical protein